MGPIRSTGLDYFSWLIEEWRGGAAGRQIPLVLIPFWEVDRSVAKVQRVAARGARAVSFPEAPHNLGLPSFHARR